MKQWIAEKEMRVSIITDWKVGSPIIVKGHHNNADFENKGTVLLFEPNSMLRYSHFSSLSRLPDAAENYTIIEFRLARTGENSTSLNVTFSNLPSEPIFKHFEYYWRITTEVMKRFIENTLQNTTSRA